MLEANGIFYLVYRYTYDGENGFNDPIFSASEYTYALNYLHKLASEDEAYEWNTDAELRKLLPGQYSYETVYIEKLYMNEEL